MHRANAREVEISKILNNFNRIAQVFIAFRVFQTRVMYIAPDNYAAVSKRN